ncbi:TetR/AcrR family transcriptional regulator [Spirillospora sp. NPDC050679]
MNFDKVYELSPSPGRRRADAERSRAAVLAAAVRLLNERPDTGMAAIAEAAEVTRQTVYAHFPTRGDLVAAVIDHITAEVAEAMDAAAPDEGPAPDALLRLLDAGYVAATRYRGLRELAASPVTREADRTRHDPITARLRRVVERGREDGKFERRFPSSWLVAAVLALAHAAGEEAAAGRMTDEEAREAVRSGALRVLGADR